MRRLIAALLTALMVLGGYSAAMAQSTVRTATITAATPSSATVSTSTPSTSTKAAAGRASVPELALVGVTTECDQGKCCQNSHGNQGNCCQNSQGQNGDELKCCDKYSDDKGCPVSK